VTAVIAIDGPALVKKGADEKSRSAVPREVIGLDSHAAHGVALPVRAGAAHDTARLQLPVTQVSVLEVGHLVVADEDVRSAVAIEIENDNAQTLAFRLDTRGLAHVRESAVAVIPQEHAARAMEFPWSTHLAFGRIFG